MRPPAFLCLVLLSLPATAQNWYVPDSNPVGTGCNVIPFGQNVGGPFYNSKYQMRCTAAALGGQPGVISGLAFSSCLAGRAHYDRLEIVLDHIPAAQPLVNTFAANLTPAAVTVLDASNYTWHLPGNQWAEVGLQNFFVYNGVDDLVVEITSTNGIAPVQGFNRDLQQRLYWIGASTPHGTTGSLGTSALKIEVSMLTAHTSRHGDGCAGSNGTPTMTATGLPQLGNTFTTDLAQGTPNGVAVLVAGLGNAAPLPLDLGILGAPGCYAYTDLLATAPVLLDPVGAGTFAFPVPMSTGAGFLFYAQYAVLDLPANPFGFTTSNYLRVLVGL